MALPLNKPSSSSSAASNPNPRSSEISNPMRRSFSGNPFAKPSVIANPRSFFPNTPANSPSDFPRRNSVGGRDVDDKENGKDQILKPAKVRSPSGSLKSKKSFMSSTISASSKITESPRKKILIDRNETARTSIASNDGKSPIRKVTFALDALLFDGVPNDETHGSCMTSEELSGEIVHDTNIPLIPKNEPESSFETFSEEPDCVNLDPSFKLSPTPPPASSTATILASIDADPLMPPYDPKTNYLSPRPQFLHYKPKPRRELCNEREFEDSLISGSFSDTEVTENVKSEGSQKDSEDVSSNEIVKEEEGQISEPSPARTLIMAEDAEAKEVPKLRFSARSKAIALILLLSLAFLSLSVTNYPVIDQIVFEGFYETYESSDFSEFAKANLNFDRFSELAKANFNESARNFHVWFTKSLSSISELISNVRGEHKLPHIQYSNLTVLHGYIGANQYPVFGHGEKEIGYTPEGDSPVLNVQESDAVSDVGTDDDIEEVSEKHYEVYEEHVQQDIGVITGSENASDDPESEELFEGQPATLIEPEHALQLAEAGNLEAKQAQENDDADFRVENQPGLSSEAAEIQILQYGAGNLETKRARENDANFNVENLPGLNSEVAEIQILQYVADNLETKQAQENDANFNVDKQSNLGLKHSPGSASEDAKIHSEVYDDKTDMKLKNAKGNYLSVDAAIRGIEQRLEAIDLPSRMVLYLLLFGGTALIAGAAFKWSRKGEGRSTRAASSVEQSQFGKALHANSLLVPKEKTSLDEPSLRNGPIEMDVLEEPSSSEMSSFQKNSSYSQKVVKNEFNESASIENKRNKNYRRESMASSSDYSMDSPSYGSVTMYEKIPSKHGRGDEEIITPVRRSSRIRNQATSPL